MWILPLVGYAGAIIGFCFLTLAIASGLYYMSELVEEHTVFAKRFLTKLIYAIIVAQALLWLIDGFPFGATLLGIVSHVVYLGNMRRFPFVKLTDPLFILSCSKCHSGVRSLLPPKSGLSLPPPYPASKLTHISSSGSRGSLCLVQTLLAQPVSRILSFLLLRKRRRPQLHHDRLLLWPLCLAGPLLALREPLSRR